jgi:hypothetical protein
VSKYLVKLAVTVISITTMLSATSCVQRRDPSPETDGAGARGPAIETRDEGDDDAQPEMTGSGTIKNICIAAAGSVDEKEAFCRSALVPPHKKQGCWMRVLPSPAEWIGWCAWNF